MSSMKDELIAKLKQEDDKKYKEPDGIQTILCQFADLRGDTKELSVDRETFEKNLEATVDGSSVFNTIVHAKESDFHLQADVDTIKKLPWDHSLARIACDVYVTGNNQTAQTAGESPFDACPRFLLKNLVKKMETDLKKILKRDKQFKGKTIESVHAYFAPELEFFLLPPKYDCLNIHKDIELKNDHYYAPISKDVRAVLEPVKRWGKMMGIDGIKYHSEVARHQYEFGATYRDAVEMADNIMIMKFALGYSADEHGFTDLWMPKPNENVNGSGMHMHVNIGVKFKGEEKVHKLFYDENSESGMSKYGESATEGILKYCPEIIALTNPTINSSNRLVKDMEAPVFIAQGYKNRTCAVRIVASGTPAVRPELRLPDPSCNIYLGQAAVAAAILAGIKERLKLRPADERDLYTDNDGVERLPDSLKESLKILNGSEMLRSMFGEEAVDCLYKTGMQSVNYESRMVTDRQVESFVKR